MTKRQKRSLQAFMRIQQRSARYCVSPHDAHTQAIREHIQRGFEEGLTRKAGLLDQRNKI